MGGNNEQLENPKGISSVIDQPGMSVTSAEGWAALMATQNARNTGKQLWVRTVNAKLPEDPFRPPGVTTHHAMRLPS